MLCSFGSPAGLAAAKRLLLLQVCVCTLLKGFKWGFSFYIGDRFAGSQSKQENYSARSKAEKFSHVERTVLPHFKIKMALDKLQIRNNMLLSNNLQKLHKFDYSTICLSSRVFLDFKESICDSVKYLIQNQYLSRWLPSALCYIYVLSSLPLFSTRGFLPFNFNPFLS